MLGRRILNAMHEYTSGRDLLPAYVQKLPQTNSHFLQAMNATTHFEQSIASACQATALFERLIKLASQSKLDDDRTPRLKLIWNRSKHFDEDLVDRKIADAEITAPVWLTNHGISSTEASVTFDELHSHKAETPCGFVSTFMKTIEITDLETRLTALEKANAGAPPEGRFTA
jgi:hypothetical protein